MIGAGSTVLGLTKNVITMIAQELESLTQKFPECQIAALVDISSGIILSAATQTKQRQERLDRYAALTSKVLASPGTQSLANALGATPKVAIQEASISTRSATCVFFRSAQEPNEAVFCICTKDIEFDKFLQCARTELEGISDVQ